MVHRRRKCRDIQKVAVCVDPDNIFDSNLIAVPHLMFLLQNTLGETHKRRLSVAISKGYYETEEHFGVKFLAMLETYPENTPVHFTFLYV